MTSTQSGAGKSEKTKQKIVTASRDLFAKKGYSETSVRDILEALRLVKAISITILKEKSSCSFISWKRITVWWWRRGIRRNKRCTGPLISSPDLQSQASQMGINYPLMRASEEFCASAFTSDEVMERLNKIDADFDDVMRDILLEGNEDGVTGQFSMWSQKWKYYFPFFTD